MSQESHLHAAREVHPVGSEEPDAETLGRDHAQDLAAEHKEAEAWKHHQDGRDFAVRSDTLLDEARCIAMTSNIAESTLHALGKSSQSSSTTFTEANEDGHPDDNNVEESLEAEFAAERVRVVRAGAKEDDAGHVVGNCLLELDGTAVVEMLLTRPPTITAKNH